MHSVLQQQQRSIAGCQRVPQGFVLTTAAYRLFLEQNRLHEPIRNLLKDLSDEELEAILL